MTWDALYQDERHRLAYPSEHVVRFLAPLDRGKALDIGCGSGRHMSLLRDMGFDAYGVEPSKAAVDWNRENSLSIATCDMTKLVFQDDQFDVGLAYGVFYYGTMGDADKAVHEMHRVMRPGGSAFVCVRSCRDWRMDHTDSRSVFHLAGEPEDGMTLDFINQDEVEAVYGGLFATLHYEIAETTTHDRDRLNSDWLITVTK